MGVAGRLAGLDAVKGVCIVFVVMIHAAPSDSPLYSAHVIGGLTRLAVPCFLAITGFLAGMRGTGPARFRTSFWTFVRLHLLYGVFYGLWGAAFMGLPDPLTAKFVVMRFGEAAWAGQYYFVVLIQLFLFLTLLPAGLSWRAPAWLWGSAAAACSWLLLLVAVPDIAQALRLPRLGERLLSTPSALPLWFLFFALGAHMGERYAQAPTGSPAPVWCRGALALGLAVGTLALPSWPAWESGYPYARLPILAGAALVASGLPALASLELGSALTRLGRNSFGIFALNPAILMLLKAALGAPATIPDSLLRVAATVAIASLLTDVLRRRVPWALP